MIRGLLAFLTVLLLGVFYLASGTLVCCCLIGDCSVDCPMGCCGGEHSVGSRLCVGGFLFGFLFLPIICGLLAEARTALHEAEKK